MSFFDALRTSEQGMSVHRFRSEVAAQNLSNAYTPGYRHKVVDLRPGSFGAALASANAGSAVGGGGPASARRGAVEIAGVRTIGASSGDDQRQMALAGVLQMMEAKSAFELNVRASTMIKSMMLSSLEIGRGA